MIQKNKETEAEVKEAKLNKLLNGIGVWTSFYRSNPHRFAKDYLGINLHIFQEIILCEMFRESNSMFLATRGIGKSWLTALFAAEYCILYPETIICVASATRGQAKEIIDKIDIMRKKSSNLAMEIKDLKTTPNDAHIDFCNGSRIAVVTAADSARHNRATILLLDEFRMIDKDTIDTVLKKFLTSRREPKYLEKPEYKNYPKEKAKEIYASSCWYESHWSYQLARSYAVNMVKGRSYFCCSMPYQLAIKEDMFDKERIEDEMSESTFSEVTFLMEMCALFFAQGKGGLYSYDDLEKNRKIEHVFYPRSSNLKITDKRFYAPPKQPGEKRILSADIALMSSDKNKNDATSIFINFMQPTSGGRYVKNIVYTDNQEGLRTDTQALNIRRLYNDYDCDFLVIDGQGIGAGVVDLLMKEIYDPETGNTYPALSCYNNEEIAKRCVDPNAPKTIWCIKAYQEFNSTCTLGLREEIKQGLVRLPISEYNVDEVFASVKGYSSLAPADSLDLKMPYINTTLLINELINLEYEVKNNVIKVKEKSGARKDRYSSLAYNIYVAKAIEREESESNSNSLIEELVLEFRAPKIKKKY